MPAELIDGRAIAKKVRADVDERAKKLIARGVTPGLAVVLVGDDPASAVYTAAKAKAAEEAGMYSLNVRLSAETTQAELLSRVDALNKDPRIHGILVQMPLPKQIDPDTVPQTKSVEVLLPFSQAIANAVIGRVIHFQPERIVKKGIAGIGDGQPLLLPCTQGSIISLLNHLL